ncbi:MAG: bifunctional oligoribonuclease/PAP phosphatase NrnA [Patescibacteria group bacterium]
MTTPDDNMRQLFDQLEELVKKHERILLTSHARADGDGLGSMLGLLHHLRDRDKKIVCFAKDFTPGPYHFMPGVDEVTSNIETVHDHQPQLVILLDSANIERTHIIDHLKSRSRDSYQVVNIDHHPADPNDADEQKNIDLQIVDHGMSSTAEIVFHYFDHHNHNISRPTATCLLTGILTDTGNFSNKATTDSSMSAAGSLLISGANLQQITEKTIRNKSVGSLKLWGRALSRLIHDPKTGIVSTAILQQDLADYNVNEEAADGIANFLNNLDGAKAVIIFREETAGVVRGSLRTTRDDVDVAKLAAQYGGGGHTKAAGFTTNGKLIPDKTGWRIEH